VFEVTVNKVDLLTALRANRDRHRAIFEEALAGWRDRALEELDRQAERVRAGRRGNVQVVLPAPQDHTADYERVIGMLELDVEDQITLSEQDYAQYVDDDWGWRRQWLAQNSAYSATAQSYLADS
jgi:hypothetical protein